MLAEQEIAAARDRVAAMDWYHSMDLGHGIRTQGVYDPLTIIDRYQLPDLHGKSVLDIGAFNGFWSFEAERRGAARVVASDHHANEGLLLAKQLLDSKIEQRRIDLYDLSPEAVGTFDVVLFLGILYHMPHPLLSLERAASVCDDLLVLETHVDLEHLRRPAMAFYEGSELNDDPTNWCGPNTAAVMAMLRTAGFTDVRLVWPGSRAKVVGKYLAQRARGRVGQRIIVHARKPQRS
jgi:tRNA (mo5U34)-methyltransferase